MELHVFAMVLAAAVLHAAWNALLKSGDNGAGVMVVLSLSQFVVSLLLLPFVPVPDATSWVYLAAAVVLHAGYMLFLALSYRFGDLSHVYPIARGSAPLIVAVVSVTLVDEPLSQQGFLAITVIALGIMSLALTRGAEGFRDLRPVLLALGTGCFIATYTVVDGLGARLAGSPHGYMVWVTLLDMPLIVAIALIMRKGAGCRIARATWRTGSLAGLANYAAFWLVIWAMTLAPIALVAALRETSVVFALLFGVVFLKERLNLVKVAATMATLGGAVMLKLSR